MDNLDIYRSAKLVIAQQDEPELYALMKADEMLDRGDLAGVAAWRGIARAVKDLLSELADGTIH